jgi:hypothetical protein
MLQYLSGVGIGKSAKRQAKKSRPSAEERREAIKEQQLSTGKKGNSRKKAISVTKKQAKGSRLSPVTKSRINKLQVQSKIRKAFVKKAEPIKVTDEEILEETNKPTEEIVEEQAEETPSEETQSEAIEESEADLGIYYPNFGRAKKKLKIKVPKLKGKLKQAVQKAKKRLKDDKHKPAEKVAHQLAKQALLIPRGAFLAIMLLGKALEKSPIKINIGKKVAEVWAKKNKEIKEFWYKVGGEADILEKQIQKFQSSKISGLAIGSAIAAGGSVAAASPIVVKFLKIVGKAKEFAEKNPKLLAQGQALVKKGIEQVAQKNPQQLKSLNVVADEITKVLPPETQSKINKIRKSIPTSAVDKAQKNVVSEVKNINQEAGTSPTSESETKLPTKKSNTMLYVGIGGAVLVGAFLLMKKKK